MPSSELSVNPPKLLKSSETIEVPQQTVQNALNSFYTKIGGLPEAPWGTDEIGEKFFVTYSGQDNPTGIGYQMVLQSISDLIDGLGNLSDKTKVMANHFITAENSNIDMA